MSDLAPDITVEDLVRAAEVDRRRRARWRRQHADAQRDLGSILHAAATARSAVAVRLRGGRWVSGTIAQAGPEAIVVQGRAQRAAATIVRRDAVVAIVVAPSLGASDRPRRVVAPAMGSLAAVVSDRALGRRVRITTDDGWAAVAVLRAVATDAILASRRSHDVTVPLAAIVAVDVDVAAAAQSDVDRSALPTTSG
ncbi:MAG: hypothetical protein R2701_13045 [Acidimicrobiales bacterium]